MRVFNVNQVARMCKVTPKTVREWFNLGLTNFRLPGTGEERIPEESLRKFSKEHGLTLEDMKDN